MVSTINPAEFHHIGDIKTKNVAKVRGESRGEYVETYSGVRSKKMLPLKGSEGTENNQRVAVERNSWVIRKENYSIGPKDTIYEVESKQHSIVSVREYKGEPLYFILDTEYRDNQ